MVGLTAHATHDRCLVMLAFQTRSLVDAFGIRFDGTGTSGFNAPFAWAA